MPFSAGTAVSGLIFGCGLTLSGVASPQVIRDQLSLKDFHMLVTFLTASVSSSAVMAAYNSRSKSKPLATKKQDSTLGWIGKYDGNVIGGAMMGLGMALTGACPGTVFVQATAGIGRSRSLLAVSVLAGAVFVEWKKRRATVHLPSSKSVVTTTTGWSDRTTGLVCQASVIAMIAAALGFAGRSDALLHPVLGGLLIGIGQLSSVLLVKKTVGISAVFEDLGKMACGATRGKGTFALSDSIVFATGVVTGAAVTMLSIPATLEVLSGSATPSLLSILVGGFGLVFGARIAGGCTIGHGISGMAGTSLSSFITMASTYTTGIVASLLLSR